MFVDLIVNSVNMSYQCNGINGSTKLTLSSNYLYQPENGTLYDSNFYLTEYLKKETQLRVLRLESSILTVPSYLDPAYLTGSYECGAQSETFDATDDSLCHIAGLYIDPKPNGLIAYYTVLDRILFRLLQFLKRVGQCLGDEMKFEFIDDVDNHYHYNQFSAVTLTENELQDLLVNTNHFNVLYDFANKRNFCLTIVNDNFESLLLTGPIRKIFGKPISSDEYDITFDDQQQFYQLNLFGPLYYTIETNLVNSHINNVLSRGVSADNLLRVISFENKQPGFESIYERTNDGGCLQVDDPTIDWVNLVFRDHHGDHLLSLRRFIVTLVMDYVILPKEEKPEFFSLDKIRRATADKVRDQLTKRLKTG